MTDTSGRRSPAQIAERLQRRRIGIIWAQSLLFLVWQGSFWNAHHLGPVGAQDMAGPLRTVDHVRISAYVVWAAALLVLIQVGGGLRRGPEVRAILNDEVTVAHRRKAFVAGFWALMAAVFGVYLLGQFEPMSTLEVAHILLTVGVVTPGLTFVILQRRSDRGA